MNAGASRSKPVDAVPEPGVSATAFPCRLRGSLLRPAKIQRIEHGQDTDLGRAGPGGARADLARRRAPGSRAAARRYRHRAGGHADLCTADDLAHRQRRLEPAPVAVQPLTEAPTAVPAIRRED